MVVTLHPPMTIDRLYEYSQKLGYNPEWLELGQRFHEALTLGDSEVDLRISRTLYSIELEAGLLSLSEFTHSLRACLLEYFLKQNARDMIYTAINENDILLLKSTLVLSPDWEATLGHYIRIRHLFLVKLSQFDQTLARLLQDCHSQT